MAILFQNFQYCSKRPIPGTQTHEAALFGGFGSFHSISVFIDTVDA